MELFFLALIFIAPVIVFALFILGLEFLVVLTMNIIVFIIVSPFVLLSAMCKKIYKILEENDKKLKGV